MNEPMSSREIEDVLSSIRRLVSDDLRPTVRPATPQPPTTASKLLLTPALRVVPRMEAEEDVVPEAAVTSPDGDTSAARRIEDVVASLGAAVEPDSAWEAEAAAPEWGDAAWPSLPEVVEVDLDSVAEAEVLDFVSADQARLEEAWRDGAWPDGPHPEELEEPSALDDAETAIESDPAAADLAEAEVVAELSRAVEDEVAEKAAAEPGLFAPGDADDFDEEALREVVRDIIREELQGALGERITRNVRKLVRAEISRAIASRDLS